ncbi:unnamed protein product (macronuclear) [Paramecium tetraurelia]|uniref:Uncharacterized protein n=1 Tax=Paramecium tetraurelia TaxID=5888 RepID=A0DM41_PARTE|nr:uncharacterized protein GSPATT00018326001 [Paramecium tetraurelia]CAK84108.1 unnamed protein product [Paramecium tetraurelia]|eukprot:XP_001451505.1 hypothetical protein (macronuclear) [Paramecium tetraurelia strain d4-2]
MLSKSIILQYFMQSFCYNETGFNIKFQQRNDLQRCANDKSKTNFVYFLVHYDGQKKKFD